MNFTQDELTVLIEALREYRVRVPEGGRRILCEALVYRLGKELVGQAEQDLTNKG